MQFGNMSRELATMSVYRGDHATIAPSVVKWYRAFCKCYEAAPINPPASCVIGDRIMRGWTSGFSPFSPQGDWHPDAIRYHGNIHSTQDFPAQRRLPWHQSCNNSTTRMRINRAEEHSRKCPPFQPWDGMRILLCVKPATKVTNTTLRLSPEASPNSPQTTSLKIGYSHPAATGIIPKLTNDTSLSGSRVTNANAAFFCLALSLQLPAGMTSSFS